MELIESFRQRAAAGEPAWGTFLVELQAPGVPPVLAHAGFQFVIIDLEHGTYSMEQVRHLLDASRAARIVPFVRVPLGQPGVVTTILDGGAAGILFPQVRTLDQAREAVALTKYPPWGRRGVHMLRPHTDFNPPADPAAYMRRANRSLVTAIQIETLEATELIDDIAAVEGIDMLYIGPSDLSANLGQLGHVSHPAIQDAMRSVGKACARHGKLAGSHVADAHEAARLREYGFSVFGYTAALRLLAQGAASFIQSTRHRAVVSTPASHPSVPPLRKTSPVAVVQSE